MKVTFNTSPSVIISRLSIVFVILSILNLMVQLSKYAFGYREQWMFIFNMDREVNFPTLYTVLILYLCSFLIKHIRQSDYEQGKTNLLKYWKTLRYVFIYLALDEALQIHEIFIIPDLGKQLPGLFHFVWVVPYGLVALYFVNYFWKFVFLLPPKTRNNFILSGAIYIGAALGLEMVEGVWVRIAGGMQNLVYALISSVEEMLEIVAILLLINTLLNYIIKYNQEQEFSVELNIVKDKVRAMRNEGHFSEQ